MENNIENNESWKINLEEIAETSESEFTKYFRQWLERDDTARSLQAKLRRDLIEIFNKTGLGCKISTQCTNLHGIMLSPLILVLNTIVAEFLYAQNYHYSLSVFCTEIPYRHTLPNFEKTKNFRFNEIELHEIFEAISPSIKIPTELQQSIIDDYLKFKSTNKTEISSLLYCIFNNVFVKLQKEISSNVKTIQDKKQNNVDLKTHSKKENTATNNQIINYTYYLHKYLLILSKKIKDMSKTLRNLEKCNDLNSMQQQKQQKSSMKIMKNHKFELLNRSLSNLSTNLRYLLMSKRKNRKISDIVQALEKMTKQFEQCTKNIEFIAKKLSKTAPVSSIDQNENKTKREKTYYEWIDEMKTTKSGKKFLAKIESCLLKTLENEKEKLFEDYRIEIEKQRQLIDMKYKEKLLQDLCKQCSQDEEARRIREKSIEETIEEKFQNLGLMDITNLKQKKEISRQNQEIQTDLLFNNVSEKRSTLQDIKQNCIMKENEKVDSIISLQQEILKKLSDQPQFSQHVQPLTVPEPDVKKIDSTMKTAEKSSEVSSKSFENFKPQLHEITKTILQKERNVDQIIFESKLRIQELENENNQLNKLFEDYLNKQKANKSNVERNVTGIWDDYKFGKTLLQKKCDAIKATKSLEKIQKENELRKLTNNNELFLRENMILPFDSLQIDTDVKNLQNKRPEKELEKTQIFENPFRELQKHFQCRQNCKMNWNLNEIQGSNEKVCSGVEIGDKSPSRKIESPKKRDDSFCLKLFSKEKGTFQIVEHNEDRQSVDDNRMNKLKTALDEIEMLPHLKMNTISTTNNRQPSPVSPIKLLSSKNSMSTSSGISEVKRKLFDISNSLNTENEIPQSEKNTQNNQQQSEKS